MIGSCFAAGALDASLGVAGFPKMSPSTASGLRQPSTRCALAPSDKISYCRLATLVFSRLFRHRLSLSSRWTRVPLSTLLPSFFLFALCALTTPPFPSSSSPRSSRRSYSNNFFPPPLAALPPPPPPNNLTHPPSPIGVFRLIRGCNLSSLPLLCLATRLRSLHSLRSRVGLGEDSPIVATG